MLPTNNDVARECLKKLHAICTDHGALPSSYILSSRLVEVGPYSVYHCGNEYSLGSYRGDGVGVVVLSNLRSIKKVRTQHCVSSQRLLMDTPGYYRSSPT